MKKITILICFFATFFLNAQRWTYYNVGDGLIDAYIYNIEQDNEGNYWFCSWVGFDDEYNPYCKYDGTNFTQFGIDDGILSEEVRDFIIDSNGNHWLATDNGVLKYDGSSWINYTIDDGLIGNDVWSIIEDNNGNIWIGSINATEGGLNKFDGTTWTSYINVGNKDIIQDNEGNIWSINGNTVYKFDGTNWLTYDSDDGIISNYLYVIYQDNNNNIWVGSHDPPGSGGLNKFDGTTWTSFTVDDGLSHNVVRAITQDTNGILWFGTDNGLSKYDGNEFEIINEEDGLMGNRVRSIYQDINGDMWFGTFEGVSKFEPNEPPSGNLLTFVPDDNFEQRLIDLGYDDVLDDYALTSKIIGKRVLNIDGIDGVVNDFQGIENFKALKSFSCEDCELTNIDFLNQNLILNELSISNNPILNPNLNQFSRLKVFNCMSTPLIGLNNQISHLEKLFLVFNQLPNLDISLGVNLVEFTSMINFVETINLSENINLKYLDLTVNSIDYIDISHNNELISLTVNNNMESNIVINVSEETNLTHLSAINSNSLNNINISQLLTIEELNIRNSNFSNLNLSQNINLKHLDISENQFSSINFDQNINLEYLNISENQFSSINLDQNINLEHLDLSKNQFNSINLDQNINLEYLNISENQLSNLNILNNQNLDYLRISENQLSDINLSNNTMINYFYANNNLFTNIDLRELTVSLRDVNVSNNQLTNLDLRNNNNSILFGLNAINNPNLTCIYVDDIDYSIENWTFIDPNSTFVETEEECEALNLDDIELDYITMYPNPVNDVLYINNNLSKIVNVKILNLIGEEVLSKKINTNFISIDLLNLPSAVYVISFTDVFGKTKSKKIIKQ